MTIVGFTVPLLGAVYAFAPFTLKNLVENCQCKKKKKKKPENLSFAERPNCLRQFHINRTAIYLLRTAINKEHKAATSRP